MAAKISPRTKLFALGASSNALGTVNDIALARRLTREVGALLVIDAVHYAPHFPLDVSAMDADFLLCSGYKFYGPHVGVLYSRPGALDRLPTDRLSMQDPAAPYRIETGTLNHAAIEGAARGDRISCRLGRGRDAAGTHSGCHDRHRRIRTRAGEVLPRSGAPMRGVQVWGPDFSQRSRAPTVSITWTGKRGASGSRAGRRKAFASGTATSMRLAPWKCWA